MGTKPLFVTFVILSFVLGWLAGARWHPGDPPPEHPGDVTAPAPVFPAGDPTSPPSRVGRDASPGWEPDNCECRDPDQQAPVNQSFATLLQQRRFGEALQYYRRAVQDGSPQRHELRKQLLAFMREKMRQLNYREFIELAGLFLEEYYDDTAVLLIAASFNQRMGYLEEAIGLFQQAQLYAYQPVQKRQVAAAYDEFVRSVDALLAGQGRWLDLSNFYAHTATLGLIRPADRIRLAQLYYREGNPTLGREMLASLDDDPHWRDQAARAQQQWDTGEGDAGVPAGSDTRQAAEAIALRARGEHYLVPVYFDDRAAHLILDTGASMVTLTRPRFDTLTRGLDTTPLGSRMFHTANGVSNGEVYRVEALRIGRYELQDIAVAVLDVSMGGDADGLLGMNVLKHFQFEIDQDGNRLLLEAR